MLRIANMIEDGRLGGPQIRIVEVARELAQYDIETTVIYPKYQSDVFKDKLDQYKIKAVKFPLHRLSRNKIDLLRYSLFFIYEIIILYIYFKREHFDILHCSGGSWQYKGIIAGKLAGLKTIWHLNDTGMPHMIMALFRLLSRFADGFIVEGSRVRKYYLNQQKLARKPVFEIQAPVSTKHFNPQKAASDQIIAQQHGIKIITIGNINPLKGYEYFLKMVHILNESHENLLFFIIGAHFDSQINYTEKLLNLKKKLKLANLSFYGACRDVRRALKPSDIYVCPSISEASPMSVWEAMSMGKAIVATDVGDVARFLTNKENGFVVPAKDPDSLAAKVDILIRNPDLRKKFGEKAMKVARKNLDVQITARHHRDAYFSLLN